MPIFSHFHNYIPFFLFSSATIASTCFLEIISVTFRTLPIQKKTNVLGQILNGYRIVCLLENLEEIENRRLEVLSANIQREKETKIQASRENMESQIRQIQTSIQSFAILLPPVPVFVMGIGILIRRQRREREGALAADRIRKKL